MMMMFTAPRCWRKGLPSRSTLRFYSGAAVQRRSGPWWRWALWAVAGSTAGVAFLKSDSPYKTYIASFWRRSPYPPPIQAHLRAALSAEHGLLGSGTFSGDADPLVTAEKHYIAALKQCAQLRLSPDDDTVTGIQIQYAALKEKQAAYAAAASILEEAFTTIQAALPKHQSMEDRQERALKLVGMAQKIGDLHVRLKEWEDAEGYYVWGVESLLMITKRKHGLPAHAKPGAQLLQADDVPLSPLLNALAMLYRAQQKHAAAAHLFQSEYDLVRQRYPGRAMIIACNVAESLTAEAKLKEAKMWLEKAQTGRTAAHHQKQSWSLFRSFGGDTEDMTSQREAECIVYNSLGKIAEMEGQVAEARACYQQSLALSKKHTFVACAVESERNLKHLDSDDTTTKTL